MGCHKVRPPKRGACEGLELQVTQMEVFGHDELTQVILLCDLETGERRTRKVLIVQQFQLYAMVRVMFLD